MTARAIRGMVMALALLALTAWTGAEAAEIRVLSTVGMQPAVSELFAQFERASGHKVAVTYGLAAVLKQSFADGRAAADVLVLTSPLVEDLAKQGKVAPGSKVDVARSGVGVGVKAGAPRPDISTPEALKSAVLAAKSVGFAKEGASGVAFARALERLGITEQVRAKYKDTGTKTGEALVAGDIDLGASQIPELMAVPGVDVVGPLPAELQTVTIFSIGLATEAKEADAAKALLQFLAGPAAAPVYKAKGLGG
jgi:molybdate transport system substrate-binding protein